MGIGRLAFLEFVEEAVGKGATQERVIRGDYFVCPRLGLGFVKPSAWHFRAFEDFFPILEGQKLMGTSGDDSEEFAEDWRSLVGVISKYPLGLEDDLESNRFTPSITINKYSSLLFETAINLEAAAIAAIEKYSELRRDYRILEPTQFQSISMCPAIRFTSQFVFEHRHVPATLVRNKTLIIDQGQYIYCVNLYDSPTTGEAIGAEFDAFVGSLHLA
jgi:hypothetical protein